MSDTAQPAAALPTEASPVTPTPKKLTSKEKETQRRQKEILDSLNRKATATHQMLCDKFFDFFLGHNDPDGPEVLRKIKEVSAQWKVFCKRQNLTNEAFPRVEMYCTFIVDQYRAERDGKPKIPIADEQQPESKTMDQAGSGQPDQPETEVRGNEMVRGSEPSAGVGAENPQQ